MDTSPVSFHAPGVLLTLFSDNKKLGRRKMHALSLTQDTCPDSCPLFGNGCYAQQAPLVFTTYRLNRGGQGQDHRTIARNAAALIRQTPATAPLRLFVVGDAHCADCAADIVEGALDYISRGQYVFGYTHNWRRIPVAVWQGIPVFASCETPEQAATAWAAGYVPAIVTPDTNGSPMVAVTEQLTAIVCPAQRIPGMDCARCGLCFRHQARLRKLHRGVAFLPHGVQHQVVAQVVRELRHETAYESDDSLPVL